jgi:glycosyltransferase involved in cell wall biosynthesis
MLVHRYDAVSAGFGVVLRTLVALSAQPDIVLSNSQAGIRFHEALGYKPKRWLYVPNPLDLEKFRPDPNARAELRRELGVAPNVTLIGLVARFDPMKDHSNFISAGRFLSNYRADLHFVLVGRKIDTSNELLMQQIRSSGIADRFHLLGPRSDINRITAGFDIACSSSIGEGSPNVVGEAMACGVPCLVTDVGDSAMIVGHTGKVVPAKDPKAFAEACQSLLDIAPEERQRLGFCARELAEERFSLRSVVGRYETLYEQVSHAHLS